MAKKQTEVSKKIEVKISRLMYILKLKVVL